MFALSIIANNVSDIYDEEGGSMDANTELTAFWAQFLLLHLGGPVTITAYALEDNELWLRHFLGLCPNENGNLCLYHGLDWLPSFNYVSLNVFCRPYQVWRKDLGAKESKHRDNQRVGSR
ncbi:hypothetical protein Q3G72_020545 [Acer saccharum]|nr:hypothetical protein Q3G72_020545 [Acer saccharum]